MGTVTLPSYESQQIEKRAPWPRRDPSAAIAAGNAQMRFLNTLFSGATAIAENIIANQRTDQMSSFMRSYSETSAQNLRDIEQNPITTRSPGFADIPEAEKGAPNLSAYTKKRDVWLAKLIADIKDPKVKRAASSWAADRWVAEKDGLARWDFIKTKEMRVDNYIEDFSAAVDNGDLGTAKDLTQAMLMTGGLTEKQADDYLDLAHKDITKRNAYLQALGMGEEKGLQYLTERGNLRYQTYDGQIKDMPLADQEEMVARFRGQMKDIDEAKNAHYQELHINANSIAACDAALHELTLDTDWKSTENRYKWEMRLRARREYLLNMQKLPKGSMDDWYKNNEDILWGQLAFAKANGVPLGQLKKMVEDSYYSRDPDGSLAPRIRGTFVKQAFEYLDMKEDPAMSAGLKYIQSKTAGLDDLEKMRVTNEFMAWYNQQDHPSQKDIENAANNFVNPVVQRNLDKHGRRTWEVLFGDKAVLDEYELLTRDIEEGKYTGIGESRIEYLARYNSYLVARAQKEFPAQDIVSAFTDYAGDYGGGPGTAILISGSGKIFAYKLEDKQLTLYRLGKTRVGTYQWEVVGKAGAAKAEIELHEAKEKIIKEEAKKKEEEILRTGREAGKTLEEEARKKWGF